MYLNMFEISRTTQGDVVILAVKGQLDALSAGKVKPLLDELLAEGQNRIVYDMKDLDLIDSSGIGAVVSTFKRSRADGGDMKLASVRLQPMEVFRVLNLHKYIETYESAEEAAASFAKNFRKK